MQFFSVMIIIIIIIIICVDNNVAIYFFGKCEAFLPGFSDEILTKLPSIPNFTAPQKLPFPKEHFNQHYHSKIEGQ